MEQLANRQIQDRDQPIPVDVYRQGTDIVIEGALPGARLEDLELTSEEGLLVVRAVIAPVIDRDYAVQEIPRGEFSRTLALPTDCDPSRAKASFADGIIRIVIPRTVQPPVHTIKVEMAGTDDGSRIVLEKPEVIDSVKGEGYRELQSNEGKPLPAKAGRRKGQTR